MAIPLALIGLKALVTLGTRLIGKKAVEAALNRGGKQALIKSVSRVQNKKPPVQKEMFNKSGTVKAGIKKSNELAAKAAKKRTASEKRKATLQAKKDAAKRRADGVAKGKVTRAKNKKTKTVAAKTAAQKKTKNRLLTGAGLGIATASLVKKPKSKYPAPIKKAKKELTAKEKFLAKRAAKKTNTARQRTLQNEDKRLKDRVYGL